jgi:hypothetical protein
VQDGKRRGIDHACAAGADSLDLGPVLLDLAIARDDEPSLAGGLGNPDLVIGAGLRDRTRRPDPSAFHRAAGIPWIGHVRSDLYQDLRETEHISVDVIANDGRLRRLSHAAVRAYVS